MRGLAGIAVWWALSAGALSPAIAASGEEHKQELSVLKEQIHSLQDEIAHSEENHEEIADSLAAADKAVSAAQRKLREMAAQRTAVEQQLERLQAQRVQLEHELEVARKALGDTVFRLYVEGGQAGARRFLSGDEPNRLARDAYYLELIARQRLATIERSRNTLLELREVIAQTEVRKTELSTFENDFRTTQKTLLDERKTQRETLSQISNQLRSQRKQMMTLQRDESRIEMLLKGLERISRVPPTRKVKPAPQSATASESGVEKEKEKLEKIEKPEKSKPITPPVAAHSLPSAPVDEGSTIFGALKGRLHWPIKGELHARFGSPRAEGGATWRGVFLRSAAGQEVKAVAAGKVAFADWLRGFGNLIIVDHGDGYMTVYGNNEALFKSPGDDVSSGETIASVGASGGLDESGLYFEIRYRGQAQDPAKWVVAK